MTPTLRILHLEDHPLDTELVQAALKAEGLVFELLHTETCDKFLAALEQQSFDLILADYTMPTFDGMSALAIARERFPDLPFIFVSGSLGEELAIETLKSGATDYVLKHRLSRLVPAVRRALREAGDRAERKRAEEELRAQKEFLRQVIDNSPNLIFVKDWDGRFTLVNKTIAEMYGTTVDGLVGKTDTDFNPDSEEVVQFLRDDRDVMTSLQPKLIVEEKATSASGQERWFQTMKVPLIAPGGTVRQVLGVSTDITERKRLEKQLVQAQKMEAIGTLAGGIAHDFNNILSAILGYTELAASLLPDDHKAQSHLAQVSKAGNRAKDLVQQILTFSRQREYDRKPVLLQPVIKEALKLLRASLPSMVEIHQHISSDAPPILGDSTQIHQIIMNLGANALHAMRERGGILDVNLDAVDVDADLALVHHGLQEGKHLRLTVSDTGHGMDSATAERIFEPFFTTKQVGEGTGLGLATVHGIVKDHRGAVMVYSEPGKGTTFNLYFPANESDYREDVAQPNTFPRGNGEHILLVDDEESLALMGQEMLERLGYEVTIHTVSTEALEAFRADRKRFDLVITDYAMPRMNGVDLARALQEIRPGMPIILTTGYGLANNSERHKAAGIREVILKPSTSQSLSEAVARVLAQSEKE